MVGLLRLTTRRHIVRATYSKILPALWKCFWKEKLLNNCSYLTFNIVSWSDHYLPQSWVICTNSYTFWNVNIKAFFLKGIILTELCISCLFSATGGKYIATLFVCVLTWLTHVIKDDEQRQEKNSFNENSSCIVNCGAKEGRNILMFFHEDLETAIACPLFCSVDWCSVVLLSQALI